MKKLQFYAALFTKHAKDLAIAFTLKLLQIIFSASFAPFAVLFLINR